MNLGRFASLLALTTLTAALFTAAPAFAEAPADAPAPDAAPVVAPTSKDETPDLAPAAPAPSRPVLPEPAAPSPIVDDEPAPRAHASEPASAEGPPISSVDSAELVAVDRPTRAYRGMHKVAFGVRAGQSRFGLSAQSLADKGMPVDNWADRALLLAPTFCVGGDGYFIKLEAPIMKTSTASAYGFGIYPLNFGYLFEQSGLFPYASAGVAASVLTLTGQGISGAFAVARLATGLKARVASGLAVSAEVGYSPFAAAALVDKQKMHDLVQSVIDGGNIDPPSGTRPARGGIGREVDFVVGLEWM